MGFHLAAASFLPGPARAQGDAAKPIGKVETAAGSVTIEHVNAVVVQAKLPSQGSNKNWRSRQPGRCGSDRTRWGGLQFPSEKAPSHEATYRTNKQRTRTRQS